MNRTKLAVALVVALVGPSSVIAHDGDVDVLGCHQDRAIGSYHCHRGWLAGLSFPSKAEAERALEAIAPPETPLPDIAPPENRIVGKPQVVDGNTLEFGGVRVRLFGMDAPDPGQTCTARGVEWRCGQDATFALAYETANHWVTCDERYRDQDDRVVAICMIGPYDLAERMVRKGWAVAFRPDSADYLSAEEVARKAGEGLWRGEFKAPSEWRQSKP